MVNTISIHQTATMVSIGPPTLFRLSAIAISKHLWRNSSLNDHLKSCIEDRIKEIRETEPMRSAAEIIINNFCVPVPAKQELKFVIGSMGCDMLSWFDKRKSSRYRLFSPKGNVCAGDVRTCADHFHWTVYGSVDEAKTMRSLYDARMFTESFFTWKELAVDCLEDCLNDLQPKLPNIEELTEHHWRYHIKAQDAEFLLVIYWKARAADKMESVIDAFYTLPPYINTYPYDETYSIEGNMFMMTMATCMYQGVPFFWNLMNENERMRALVKSCEQIMARVQFKWYCEQNYVAFILQQLVHYGLEDIWSRIIGSNILLPLGLLTWSHNYLFIQAIVESSKHNAIMNYERIMAALLWNICFVRNIHPNGKHREFFYTIWKMNLGNFKFYTNDDCLEILWWVKEVELLNHILRDPELKDRRKEFLEILVDARFKDGVVDPLFLKQFVTQVLRPGEEWFAKSFPSIHT